MNQAKNTKPLHTIPNVDNANQLRENGAGVTRTAFEVEVEFELVADVTSRMSGGTDPSDRNTDEQPARKIGYESPHTNEVVPTLIVEGETHGDCDNANSVRLGRHAHDEVVSLLHAVCTRHVGGDRGNRLNFCNYIASITFAQGTQPILNIVECFGDTQLVRFCTGRRQQVMGQ